MSPSIASQAGVQAGGQRALAVGDRVHADRSSASQAAASATAPITFGEPASKRSGASAQIDVVERDELDRAAAVEQRVAVRAARG